MSETEPSGLTPQHVAIIMDGNGRWAASRGRPRAFGHRKGVEAVREAVRNAGELGVRYLTLFSFSTENWNRPAAEVEALFELLRRFVAADLDRLHAEGVRVRILGRREGLGEELLKLIGSVERQTAGNDRFFLNIAFNYGGRDEIIRAARLAAEAHGGDLSRVRETDFARYLDTADLPDPDLVIRTSGEHRISNFLLWQAAYAEFVFMDTLWPDFDKAAFEQALSEFASRDRRYGGVRHG
ncbi:polyprenyl diphosphate synthase [Oceanicaulis sp. LC35]|uniref:polyprenyl diphosphate synthase n=1 Tax=Oceanicaulis sp. LC35 TaxID=3349635 RepID=UPI003F826810